MDWSAVDYRWFIPICVLIVAIFAISWAHEARHLRFKPGGELHKVRVEFNNGLVRWLTIDQYCESTPVSEAGWFAFNEKMPHSPEYFIAESGQVFYPGSGYEHHEVIGEARGVHAAYKLDESLVKS